MRELLKNKTSSEKADIKSAEICKIIFDKEYVDGDVALEIQDIKKIDCGVQVFAKAWKNGKQLGFGKDGNIETERFCFFNPPILVDDSNGDIIIDFVDAEGNKQHRKLREDPKQAFLDILFHAISIVGKLSIKITAGSIGNTTSTFFSGGGDGAVQNDGEPVAWSTLHGATDGTTTSVGSATMGIASESYNGTNGYEILRGFLPFDTSSIPDTDTIDSSTLTVTTAAWTGTAVDIGLVQTSQASSTTLAVGDFDQCGAITNPTEGATRITPTSTADGTSIWTLNATGLTWISKTGYTLLGLRIDNDMDNSDPGTTPRHFFSMHASEQTGTTKDPVLTVVHSAAASGPVNLKTYNGTAAASVKTMNGVAMASVKTWNGVT